MRLSPSVGDRDKQNLSECLYLGTTSSPRLLIWLQSLRGLLHSWLLPTK
jgi:hypothetical protein